MIKIGVFTIIFFIGIYGAAIDSTQNEVLEETPEWIWFPDGDGKLHLIHLKEDKLEPGPRFDVNKHVNFHLFTRRNPKTPQFLKINDVASVVGSNFNPEQETFFICHGWSSNGGSSVNTLIRDAYLSVDDYNVIVVDWANGAAANYFSARGHAASTGRHTGNFINFLVAKVGVSLNRVHLAGHSLGAHAMGFAGKAIANGKQVKTIIGLDPALPLYSFGKPKERLSLNDAEYVEILHTNAGKLGFHNAIGHADFYPNFGSTQPGCGFDLTGSCAHARSYEYFAESIVRHDKFRARRCKDLHQLQNSHCTDDKNVYIMGGRHTKTRVHGVFILHTASSPPYALG